MDRCSVPLFCIFGQEYPEIQKYVASKLSLLSINPFWTFREFITNLKRECCEIIHTEKGDSVFQDYVDSLQVENIEILEIRLNTCRGISKAIYHDLLLLYYDERRIGDHLANDYYQSEHTIIQVYVRIEKESRGGIISAPSVQTDQHYKPAPVSTRVRALVKLRLVQTWQTGYSKYKSSRIRHVMYPRTSKDNDFTRIGIVEPFRVDLKQSATTVLGIAASGDACVVQVLAYDKITQQSGWFDLVMPAHSTVRRCKERIVETLRNILDWPDVSLEEIPYLIARRYYRKETEDFLLSDDTMTLSYLLPTNVSPIASHTPRNTLPMLTVIAFAGRKGHRISDSKGRCIFEQEEHGTQLLIAAMAIYLNNYVDRTAGFAINDDCDPVSTTSTGTTRPPSQSGSRKISKGQGTEKKKEQKKLMKKERRLSQKASLDSRRNGEYSCAIL